jgi:hypothetical protein
MKKKKIKIQTTNSIEAGQTAWIFRQAWLFFFGSKGKSVLVPADKGSN